ncbi:hypothetical protein tloyanaT_26070 [Thalassotalea loyana]|uniref:Uncharacterized protein n=1 Tax=Thalassotalea loyana TaxID=280483 RepID=A0ABQ6HEE0_9GAMM|nr:hypothetical protein [Thalassotalea loyana]GLX86354.1 hypothetical protein tloyanaT_26070 [Thalassotalea loyana]
MNRSQSRFEEGRKLRLQREVSCHKRGLPKPQFNRSGCIYRRPEQANQFKRGWFSVTDVDIAHAINQSQQAQGEAHA